MSPNACRFLVEQFPTPELILAHFHDAFALFDQLNCRIGLLGREGRSVAVEQLVKGRFAIGQISHGVLKLAIGHVHGSVFREGGRENHLGNRAIRVVAICLATSKDWSLLDRQSFT